MLKTDANGANFARRHVFDLLVLLVAIPVACTERGDRITSPDQLSAQQLSGISQSSGLEDIDKMMRRVVALAPGFGGFYVDGPNNAIVVLQDVSMLTAAHTALVTVFGPKFEKRYGTRTWRAVQGQFTYTQLADWKDFLSPRALAISGITSIGVDESQNAVVIGAASDAATSLVRQLLVANQIPPAAVVFGPSLVGVAQATLNDSVRPIDGGYRIESATEFCTLGVNAAPSFNPPPQVYYFITASHCTDQYGVVDGGNWYQPSYPNISHRFAHEILDAPLDSTSAGCSASRVCVNADVALMQYDSTSWAGGQGTIQSGMGYLARVDSPPVTGNAQGPLTVAAAPRSIVIDNVASYHTTPPAMKGDELEELGVFGGFTYGNVASTCLDL